MNTSGIYESKLFSKNIVKDGHTVFGRIAIPDDKFHKEAEREEILEPELEIIDTHHHLWDLPGYRYLLEEFVADTNTGHNIVGTVYNECQSMYRAKGDRAFAPVGEIEFCAGIAAMAESGAYGTTHVCQGIVGYADLTLKNEILEKVLEAEQIAGGGRFKGIRFAAGWDADPVIGNSHSGPREGIYREEKVQAGVRLLGQMGLSFDAWAFHPQLDDVLTLACNAPDTSIILGHMGGPLGYGRYSGRRDEVFHAWREKLLKIGQCDNVSIKLGGAMMRLAAFDYGKAQKPASSQLLVERWGDYLKTCLDIFGPKRCMVESNFPVDKMGVTYSALFNCFKKIFNNLSNDEKNQIFSGTAKSVYKLNGSSIKC